MDFIVENLINEIKRIENTTVETVLVQLLGRLPNVEDYQKLTKIQVFGNMTDYDLVYENFRLGRIIFDLNNNMSITFEPYRGTNSIMNQDAQTRFELWAKP